MQTTNTYRNWLIFIQSVRHRHMTDKDTFSARVAFEPLPGAQCAALPALVTGQHATVEAAEQAALEQARAAIDGAPR